MKRLQPYLYYLKISAQKKLTYRFDIWSGLFSAALLLFIEVFLWRSLYSGGGTVSGVNLSEMLTYLIVSLFLRYLFSYSVDENLRHSIIRGDIALDFIKPVSIYGIYLAQDIGTALSGLCIFFLPLFLLASVAIQFPFPAAPVLLIPFFVSAIFGYLILWLLGALVGTLNFWLLKFGNFGMVQQILIMLFSGAYVPIWFFPEWIQRILNCLPFVYTYQLPIGIYIGRYGTGEILWGLGVQLFWVVLLFVLFQIVSRRAQKKVLVQGG